MKLTEQQQYIVETFSYGKDMAIEALAGAGKTTILVELGKSLALERPDSTAYYITFNRKNADEVQSKFDRAYSYNNANAVTVHALALRSLDVIPGYSFVRDKLRKTYPPKYINISRFVTETVSYTDVDRNDFFRVTTPTETYNIALETIRHFCMSSDEKIGAKHIPELYKIAKDEETSYINIIVPLARKMWEDIVSPHGDIYFLHDYYLKMWSLLKPEIGQPGDVILYDEAQDARDCVTSVVFSQKNRQVVVVGDHYQNIYSFMGSSNALRKMLQTKKVHRATLTTSWRFGNAIADAGTSILRYIGCDDLTLQGNPMRHSKALAYRGGIPYDVNAVIARGNHEVIEIMSRFIDAGKKVHAVINPYEIESACDDIEQMYMGRRPTKIPELKQLKDIEELLDIIEGDNKIKGKLDGASLYKVIIKRSPEVVRAIIREGVTESQADVIVSTMHKSKGREWDNVAIVWGDNDRNVPNRTVQSEKSRQPWGDYFTGNLLSELMLLYVAVTRARKTIYVPETIARKCGVDVGNAEDFAQKWSWEDFVDWVRSEQEIQPFRQGYKVDIPDDWEEKYEEARALLEGIPKEKNGCYKTEHALTALEERIETPSVIPYVHPDVENHATESFFAKDYIGETVGYNSEYFCDDNIKSGLEKAVAETKPLW